MATRAPRIPANRVPGLIKLRKLEEDSLAQLSATLSEAPPFLEPVNLINFLIPKVTTIPESDLKAILELLISLSAAQVQANVPVSQVARDVCGLMEQSENEELKIIGEQCDIFRDRLVELLNIEPLTYPAKARGVMADHDNLFSQARVLTDIRTVFGPDISSLPKGAVILHMLKITYAHRGMEDDFYVAMDSEDVGVLITALQRALAKGATLKGVLQKAELNCLNPE